MAKFVSQQPHLIEKLIHHVGSPSISDLILKLISLDEATIGINLADVFLFTRLFW
jgi:hypothetical protein